MYVISYNSLKGELKDLSGKSYEMEHIMKLLSAQLEAGASIAEIAQNFPEFKQQEYPKEVAKQVSNQKEINEQILSPFEALKKRSQHKYSVFAAYAERSNKYDPYKKDRYRNPPSIFLAQSNRDISGNMNEKNHRKPYYQYFLSCAK